MCNIVEKASTVKRDMDLVRRILMKVQEKENLDYEVIEISGVDSDVLNRHIEILYDAHLIDAVVSQPMSHPRSIFKIKDLSWGGHEFMSDIQKEEVWSKLKDSFGKDGISSMSIDALRDAAKAIATEWVKAKLGLNG